MQSGLGILLRVKDNIETGAQQRLVEELPFARTIVDQEDRGMTVHEEVLQQRPCRDGLEDRWGACFERSIA
jgi:hypothetical protein